MAAPVLRFSGIGKSFGLVRVLEDISFELRPGEVHVLAGENGAGKSTLIKILAGIHRDYDGTLEYQGQPVRWSSPHDAQLHGISVIHQEMSLIGSLSVLDNLNLVERDACRARSFGSRHLIHRAAEKKRTQSLLSQLDLALTPADLARPVEQFPISVRNRLEIAKALAFDARVVVMDEPTSALDRPDVERLFVQIGTLRQAGCCVVYITHKMEEIYRIADRITVLRDGRYVGTAAAADCPAPQLVQWMIGRELSELYPPPLVPPGAALRLELEHFSVPDPAAPGRRAVQDFSLQLRAGEIVGIAGLPGSGAAELFRGLFGADGHPNGGRVRLDGDRFIPRHPADSIRRGLAYLTADRKTTGLILPLSIGENLSLAALPRYSPGGWLRPAQEASSGQAAARQLRIKFASLDQPVATLSGGNQQKVMLAKWLETAPKVLLLEDPTRGIDLGAKREIHRLIREWTAAGLAVLLISSELPELLGLSDRVIVLHRGAVTAELPGADITPERVLAAAMGAIPSAA